MGGLYAPQTLVAVLIGVGASGFNTPAHAGDPAGFVPPYPGSQVMLYVSRPIGARGAGANVFGIRYERATSVITDPAFRYCAPLRHRSIVDLQFALGASPRMLFGPKVTWDLGRRRLGPTSMTATAWPMATQPLTGASLADWAP